MKETKNNSLQKELEKKAGRLDNDQQPEWKAELEVVDTSVCGCDVGDPCCPEDK